MAKTERLSINIDKQLKHKLRKIKKSNRLTWDGLIDFLTKTCNMPDELLNHYKPKFVSEKFVDFTCTMEPETMYNLNLFAAAFSKYSYVLDYLVDQHENGNFDRKIMK